MDVTIRLYSKLDPDLICLNSIPQYYFNNFMKLAIIAWARGDRDFTIPSPVIKENISIDIAPAVIHIRFGKKEQDVIDKINEIPLGYKGVLFKNVFRHYMDTPFYEYFFPNDYISFNYSSKTTRKKNTTPKKEVVATEELKSNKKEDINIKENVSKVTEHISNDNTDNTNIQNGQAEHNIIEETRSENIKDMVEKEISEQEKSTQQPYESTAPVQTNETIISDDTSNNIEDTPNSDDDNNDDFDFFSAIEKLM